MLIQYTSVSSLDASALQRLKSSAGRLLQSNEALRGEYVMFEGKYFRDAEVQGMSSTRQLLQED